MKKSLLALAVLGAFAGVASAQSSVTLYGTVDLNGRYVKNDGSGHRWSMGQDGINSSQLGFRGIEDLGAGLKASFILLAGVNADTGTTNTKFFNRRATVSLSGGFGEVRLGRDYTPTFWNNTIFDAFGTNGLGDSSHVQQLATPSFVRADNSIGYFLPPVMGGLYGQVMAAAGESGQSFSTSTNASGGITNTATGVSTNPGRYLGGRIGFASGPFDIAFAAGQQRFNGNGASANPFDSNPRGDQKTYNGGGSFDFGFLKLMGYYDRDETDDAKENRYSVSAVVPLGQGEIHLGGSRAKATFDGGLSGVDSRRATQYAAGYVYNLSKRTAMYTNFSFISNNDNSNRSVASGGSRPDDPAGFAAGGDSKGAEFGIRHFF